MRFAKMQGCGNDYVFVNGMEEWVEEDRRGPLAREISDRHFGVGADGMILILPGRGADFEMEMYNADGSRGEMCGNGIRCLGKYVFDKGLVSGRVFQVESGGKARTLEILGDPGGGPKAGGRSTCLVRVDMGKPVFEGEVRVCSRELTCVSMGNPHAVALLDPGEEWPVLREGPRIETAPCFPGRTNVEFVKLTGRREISMRVWERGTGETLACGTGACAAAVVCMQKGLTDEKITVKLLGGNLQVAWDRQRDRISLTGPAVTVFEGEY